MAKTLFLTLTGQLLATLLMLSSQGAAAQTTAALTGFMGDRALIMIDGGPPTVVAVGGSASGVKVLSIDAKRHLAEVEILGRPATLRLIGLPSSFGGRGPAGEYGAAPGKLSSITIPMAGDGHFYVDGYVNGHSAKFMVDTGASTIVLGEDDAKRLGIPYKEKGLPVQMSTANGAITAYRVQLDSIVLGGMEERRLDAVVGSNMPYILLGNSFLGRFKMLRNSNTMLLEKPG